MFTVLETESKKLNKINKTRRRIKKKEATLSVSAVGLELEFHN